MACSLSSGRAKGCKSAAGIVEVYLANRPSGTTGSAWYNYTETDGTVTSITGLTSAMYLFSVDKNSSSLVSTPMTSNASVGYTQTLTMQLRRYDADLANLISILGQANLVAIVKDRNGRYFASGLEEGLELTDGGELTTGMNINDLNGATLIFSCEDNNPAFEVSASIISDLLA